MTVRELVARHRRRAVRWLRGELYPERNRYRDVLLLIGMGLMLWALILAYDAHGNATRAVTQAVRAVGRVQEGRKTSITISCAVISAISSAGEAVIKGPPPVDTPFTRFLEQHGYPPAALRRVRSQRAANAYVADIDRRVSRALAQLGERTPVGLIRSDGTIDCGVLQRVSVLSLRR